MCVILPLKAENRPVSQSISVLAKPLRIGTHVVYLNPSLTELVVTLTALHLSITRLSPVVSDQGNEAPDAFVKITSGSIKQRKLAVVAGPLCKSIGR